MIRFGILAGVSSDPQAREEKASIPDQVKTCRSTIQQLGGVEVGCYVMDGYSRTGYDSLADAMQDIPPLKEAIEAAEQDRYDVLILDNWDRLGDLGQLVHTRYKKYRKQIYSARQSGRLHDPKSYNPYMDESVGIDMHIQAILQEYRINKMRRGWNIGIPRRLERGLPPFRVPFGYRRIDKDTPPAQTEYAIYAVKMKDWLLEGRALSWIAEQLDQAGVPRPSKKGKHWHVESIRHILLNPFYAGIVAIGQKKSEAGKKGKIYRQRTTQAEWTMGKGAHEPLWDEATLLAIQNEFERRMTLRNYAKTVYPLAGLLRCTVCQQKLIRRNVSRHGKLMPGLGCAKGQAHIIVEYDWAIERLAQELKKDLQEMKNKPMRPDEERQRLKAELEDIDVKRERIEEGWREGIYRKEKAIVDIQELDRKEHKAKRQLEELDRTQQVRTEFQTLTAEMAQYSVDEICSWIETDDPASVNRLLSALCKTVWIDPERQLQIDWRE